MTRFASFGPALSRQNTSCLEIVGPALALHICRVLMVMCEENCTTNITVTSRERHGVSKSSLNRLFVKQYAHFNNKITPKLHMTCPLWGAGPITDPLWWEFTGRAGEFPSQRVSNVESVSTSWRHHEQWICAIWNEAHWEHVNISLVAPCHPMIYGGSDRIET